MFQLSHILLRLRDVATAEPLDAGLHCQDRLTLLDTGVGVSGSSVGLVSVDTSVGVSGGVGRCRGRVSECRARAQRRPGSLAGAWVSMTAGRRWGAMEEAPTITLPSKAAPAGLPERDDPTDASQMHRPCGIAPAEREERERKEWSQRHGAAARDRSSVHSHAVKGDGGRVTKSE